MNTLPPLTFVDPFAGSSTYPQITVSNAVWGAALDLELDVGDAVTIFNRSFRWGATFP